MEIDKLLMVLKSGCECQEDIPFKCPSCMMTLAVEEMQASYKMMAMAIHLTKSRMEKTLEEARLLREQNKIMKSKHNIHIQALQHYYHRLHKNCPCLDEDAPGKCESPWETINA